MAGWIKIHRKLQDWGWYSDSHMVHLFIHLLLEANHEDRVWKGQIIKRGQLIFGRKAVSETLGISEQTLRTCMTRLKSTNEITSKSTNRFSLITIVNYENYQCLDDLPTNKSTSKSTYNQPATNQQLTTPKELKNVKNKEDMSGRAQRFVDFVNEKLGRKYQLTPKVKSAFSQRIQTYQAPELVNVVNAVITSTHHIETGFKYCTPEFLLRQETIERYKNGPITKSSQSPEPPKKQDYSEMNDFYEVLQKPLQKVK